MGGMGVVYAAVDERTDQRLAVKVLLNAHSRAISAFKHEFRALADLHHSNLLVLHELAVVDDQWLLAMELVDGVDFIEYADTDQKLRLSLLQLSDGLGALHNAGQIHRDIKPSNVMVTRGGRVVLLDFGLATPITRPKTEPGRYVLGTLDYIAPERLVVRGKLSHATDWYSVGVMLYIALTGQAPFSGARYDVLHSKLEHDPVPPRVLRRTAPVDLSDLCMALLRRDPSQRAGRRDVVAALSGRASTAELTANSNTPLIGRERHLEQLSRCADAVHTGKTVVATVSGESGIGKSALLESFLSQVGHRSESLVLRGRCYAREAVPYKGLDMVVEELTGYLRCLPEARARRLLSGFEIELAARLFPSLTRLDCIDEVPEGTDDISGPRMRNRASAALRSLFHRLSIGRLVVVSVDDAQWIDSDGAELLLQLLSGQEAPRLLLVLSYRADAAQTSAPLRALLEGLDSSEPTMAGRHRNRLTRREIIVGPLSAEDAEAVARSIASDANLDAPAIIANSGGNPFFLRELARFAEEHSSDVTPPTLEDAVHARVARLPYPARAILETVAVAGHPLPIAVARAAADVADPSALSLLHSRHLVRYLNSAGVDSVECYHDRIREVLAAAVPEPLRREHHGRIADALSRTDEPDPQMLALHYRAAADGERACHYTLLAAQNAERALAFDQAVDLYRMGLSLVPVDRHGELHARLGDVLAAAGRGLHAARAYQTAAASTEGMVALGLRRRAADQLLRSGRTRDGTAAFASVLEDLGLSVSPTSRRALARGLSRRAWLRLRGLGFKSKPTDAQNPRQLMRVDTLYSLASGLAMADPMRAMEVQSQHCKEALRLGDPYRAARAIASHAVPYAARGSSHISGFKRVTQIAEQHATGSGNVHAQAILRLVRGFSAFALGDWRQARNLLFDAETALLDCRGASWERATCRFFLSTTLARLGDYNELYARIPDWLVDARQRRDVHALANLRTSQAYACLAADDAEAAHEAIARATEQWRRAEVSITRFRSKYMHAQVHLYNGDVEAALAAVDEACETLKQTFILRIQEVRISLQYVRAQTYVGMALRTGENKWRRLASKHARKLAREKAQWAQPLTHVIRGGIALSQDRHERTVQHLKAAIAGFEHTDMTCYAAAAGLALADLRNDPVAHNNAAQLMHNNGVHNPTKLTNWLIWAQPPQ